MHTVALEWYEIEHAAIVGARRQVEALKAGRKPNSGYEGTGWDGGWDAHIKGACAELAVAKARNKHWHASINTFKNGPADVGMNIEVRYRSKPDYDLIVRDGDPIDRVYVLVTGEPPTFTLVGYIKGVNAQRSEWIRTYGDKRPAYFVPQSALITFPPESLIGLGEERHGQ